MMFNSTTKPATAFTDDHRLLVKILAMTDATWLPLRTWERPRPTNVHEARAMYRTAGVPWASTDTTEAGRKASQRTIEGLAQAGKIIVRRPTKTRALCCRLSDAAEAETRALAGLPGWRGAWLALSRLAELGGHAGEFQLTDRAAWPHDQVALAAMLLPALARELVVAGSTSSREVRYSLSPAGVAWLAETDEPQDHPGEPHDAAARLYDEHATAALDRLSTLEPRQSRELGLVPLAAGSRQCPLGEWPAELDTESSARCGV
jgi:hypothetical protein